MPTPHEQAVLALCDRLAAEGHTVISANTDPRGEPQVFAQSESGGLAFYFMRGDAAEPDPAARARILALAERHGVAAYWCRAAGTGAADFAISRLAPEGPTPQAASAPTSRRPSRRADRSAAAGRAR